MTVKTFYQTDINGLYTGPVDCHTDPEDDKRWMVPFGAVEDAPPTLGEKQAARRVGDSWEVIPDYRGVTYWLPDRSSHTIKDAGVTPPTGWLSEDPGPTEAERAEMEKAVFLGQVSDLLKQSDVTVIRCGEDGVPVPAAWKAWRSHLRQLQRDGAGEIGDPPTLSW